MGEVERIRGGEVGEEQASSQAKPQDSVARQLQAQAHSLQPAHELCLRPSGHTHPACDVSIQQQERVQGVVLHTQTVTITIYSLTYPLSDINTLIVRVMLARGGGGGALGGTDRGLPPGPAVLSLPPALWRTGLDNFQQRAEHHGRPGRETQSSFPIR